MPITLRSIIVGLVLIPCNVMWVVLAEYAWYSGFPTCLSLFFNAVLTMAALVLSLLIASAKSAIPSVADPPPAPPEASPPAPPPPVVSPPAPPPPVAA